MSGAVPRVAVIVFPGTWSERDFVHVAGVLGWQATTVWHAERTLGDVDAVVLPGGFAHGDHLRTGAIARFSPVMDAVRAFADGGGPVIGSCNGFQILCEAGMLPGVLMRNDHLQFRCDWQTLRVERAVEPWLSADAVVGSVVQVPINHFEGNYTCTPETLAELRGGDRVILRYVGNPNGSVDDIAGICSVGRNVVGLMPHPERASSALLGSTDGVALLRSLLTAADARGAGRPTAGAGRSR